MKPNIAFTGLLFTLFLLCSCGGGTKERALQCDTLQLDYAENLTIIQHSNCTEVQLKNPWAGQGLLQTYLLVPQERHVPLDRPEGTVIRVPLENAALFTAAHANLIEELGKLGCIGGICEPQYLSNASLLKQLKQGRIMNLGSAMAPNREKIIELNPDGILLSPFENVNNYSNLEQIGIPIIQCADYMETTALGRAEWMRFYGRLVGAAHQSDSLFNEVKNRYLSLCDNVCDTLAQLSTANASKPSVICDLKNGAAWYVPGGRSTMGELMRDARANYLFSYLSKSGSVPLSFETVLEKGQNADYWIIRYGGEKDMTLQNLKDIYQPYELFKAYQTGNVYGCNANRLIFYEEIPFHPERLLQDFISIFHPERNVENCPLRYFHKLQ